MDFQNIMVKYAYEQANIPFVGKMTAIVEISRKPIFDNKKSIDVTFFSDNIFSKAESSTPMGTSNISYKSIRSEKYSGRIMVSVILPHECLTSGTIPYDSSRKATMKLLPQIIREHEKTYGP